MKCYYCNIELENGKCPICERDAEGFTDKERQRKRPWREIAGLPRNFRSIERHPGRPSPFEGAVVPGSVRVSVLG